MRQRRQPQTSPPTGNTSNPHGVTAAQVGAAAASHAHSADDVIRDPGRCKRRHRGKYPLIPLQRQAVPKWFHIRRVYTALAGKQATATSLTATLLTTGWSSDKYYCDCHGRNGEQNRNRCTSSSKSRRICCGRHQVYGAGD